MVYCLILILEYKEELNSLLKMLAHQCDTKEVTRCIRYVLRTCLERYTVGEREYVVFNYVNLCYVLKHTNKFLLNTLSMVL